MASQSFSSALPNAKQFQLISDWPCREYAAAQLPVVSAKAQSSPGVCDEVLLSAPARGDHQETHGRAGQGCPSARPAGGHSGHTAPPGCSVMGRTISKCPFSLSAASSAGDFSAPLTVLELSLEQVLLQRHQHCPYQRGNGKTKLRLLKVASDFGSWVLSLRKFECSFSCRLQDFCGCDNSLKAFQTQLPKNHFSGSHRLHQKQM